MQKMVEEKKEASKDTDSENHTNIVVVYGNSILTLHLQDVESHQDNPQKI